MLHILDNDYPFIYLREPKVDIGYSISWLLSENMQFLLGKTCFIKKNTWDQSVPQLGNQHIIDMIRFWGVRASYNSVIYRIL